MENQDKTIRPEETSDPTNNQETSDNHLDGDNIRTETTQATNIAPDEKGIDDNTEINIGDEADTPPDQETSTKKDVVDEDVPDLNPEGVVEVTDNEEENTHKKKKLTKKKAKILEAFAKLSKKLERDIVKEKKGVEKLSDLKKKIKTINKDLSKKIKKKKKKD